MDRFPRPHLKGQKQAQRRRDEYGGMVRTRCNLPSAGEVQKTPAKPQMFG